MASKEEYAIYDVVSQKIQENGLHVIANKHKPNSAFVWQNAEIPNTQLVVSYKYYLSSNRYSRYSSVEYVSVGYISKRGEDHQEYYQPVQVFNDYGLMCNMVTIILDKLGNTNDKTNKLEMIKALASNQFVPQK